MSQIMLSQEQANVLAQATGPVILCDPQGNVLCSVQPEVWFTDEELAELERERERNQNDPGITTQELLDRLRKLAPE